MLNLALAVTLISFGYVVGTTRLAALLASPGAFNMPRGTRWMLFDNPNPSQPHGRFWAAIGDIGISVGCLLPLGLGLAQPRGPVPLWALAWVVVIVAWTVAIMGLALRARRHAVH